MPAGGEADHEGVDAGEDWVHSPIHHALVADLLEFFEISALVAELAVFETETTVSVRLANSSVFIKRH